MARRLRTSNEQVKFYKMCRRPFRKLPAVWAAGQLSHGIDCQQQEALLPSVLCNKSQQLCLPHSCSAGFQRWRLRSRGRLRGCRERDRCKES